MQQFLDTVRIIRFAWFLRVGPRRRTHALTSPQAALQLRDSFEAVGTLDMIRLSRGSPDDRAEKGAAIPRIRPGT